jgi:hypothetical protein
MYLSIRLESHQRERLLNYYIFKLILINVHKNVFVQHYTTDICSMHKYNMFGVMTTQLTKECCTRRDFTANIGKIQTFVRRR